VCRKKAERFFFFSDGQKIAGAKSGTGNKKEFGVNVITNYCGSSRHTLHFVTPPPPTLKHTIKCQCGEDIAILPFCWLRALIIKVTIASVPTLKKRLLSWIS
jgi:hypothetical protein